MCALKILDKDLLYEILFDSTTVHAMLVEPSVANETTEKVLVVATIYLFIYLLIFLFICLFNDVF